MSEREGWSLRVGGGGLAAYLFLNVFTAIGLPASPKVPIQRQPPSAATN